MSMEVLNNLLLFHHNGKVQKVQQTTLRYQLNHFLWQVVLGTAWACPDLIDLR